VLHERLVPNPSSGQSAPPFAGAGLLQVRVWVPPPQLLLQLDQSLQPPSRGQGSAGQFW
jgi:hypothetical protein